MDCEDYFPKGRRMWFRLCEKGSKHHEVPAHHKAEQFMDDYVAAAEFTGQTGAPLFRSLDRHRNLTERRLHRTEALLMIKRRARRAGLPYSLCNHSFRATGITAFLSNGGTLENAQRIAAHESPRTTSLYDRTSDEVSLDEIERIVI
ncbi:tyrosine-type recombinase/integrase [Rubinisphaera italica]|nr:tyrosine-type recombinase/integrase [Rubinisphaera italica]